MKKTQEKSMVRVNLTHHFLSRTLERDFETNAVAQIYKFVIDNINNIVKNVYMKWALGASTIVYSVDDNNVIHFITGYHSKKGTPNV